MLITLFPINPWELLYSTVYLALFYGCFRSRCNSEAVFSVLKIEELDLHNLVLQCQVQF